MTQGTLYGERAALYDAIYHWKDYPAEASRLADLLGAEGVPEGSRLLEAACGTGKHLAALAPRFAVAGYDGSEEMLGFARERLPAASLWRQDLRDPVPGGPYDALLCLFSSIGYLPDRAALGQALRAFAAALRPGGVAVIEPWIAPEDHHGDRTFLHTVDQPGFKVVRMARSTREGDMAWMDFTWLVGRDGSPVESFTERHGLWMCPRPVFAAELDAAGFDARFEADGLSRGRGLWIGRRR